MLQVSQQKDALGVLSSTKLIVEQAKFITIQEDAIDTIIPTIPKRYDQGLENIVSGNSLDSYQKDVQLLFFQNTVNFCYWTKKDVPKWQPEWPKGHSVSGGEFGMMACFQRALAEGIPVLEASSMESLSNEQISHIFRSSNISPIPLLEKRKEHLNEAGRVLREKYDGQFLNVMEAANFDAVALVELTYKDFASFADVSKFEGQTLYFLKRAQFNASSLSRLKEKKITNLDQLTAFADYKIPQMLRHFGLTSYHKSLAQKVDSYTIIPIGSREELEIRATSIWGLELIRQKMQSLTTTDIAHSLWLISQNQQGIKPYHRTYSIYY